MGYLTNKMIWACPNMAFAPNVAMGVLEKYENISASVVAILTEVGHHVSPSGSLRNILTQAAVAFFHGLKCNDGT